MREIDDATPIAGWFIIGAVFAVITLFLAGLGRHFRKTAKNAHGGH